MKRQEFSAEELLQSAWKAWSEAAASVDVGDAVPAGYKTSRELQEILGLGKSATQAKIYKLLQANKAESKYFRIMNGGAIKPVPHYRLK